MSTSRDIPHSSAITVHYVVFIVISSISVGRGADLEKAKGVGVQ